MLRYEGAEQENEVEEKVLWRVVFPDKEHGKASTQGVGDGNQELRLGAVEFKERTRSYRWAKEKQEEHMRVHANTRRSGCIWPTTKMARQNGARGTFQQSALDSVGS